jgi:hypothetical protein
MFRVGDLVSSFGSRTVICVTGQQPRDSSHFVGLILVGPNRGSIHEYVIDHFDLHTSRVILEPKSW